MGYEKKERRKKHHAQGMSEKKENKCLKHEEKKRDSPCPK
jgi:hypothetical protein